ncbi:MAG: CvpA family protein [Chloroflexota bacterium]
MISLVTTFWILVFLFAFVGMMRGWTRETIVTASVILALFTINQFASTMFGFLGFDNNVTPPEDVRRQQFYILSAILVVITFFGYQGPTIANRVAERLRLRDSVQDKIFGLLVGGINGYLVVGSIWSFLEYKVVAASNWVRYSPDVPYPFNPTVIVRPAPELAPIIDNLPIPLLTQSPYILPLLLVLVFLFVLVVLL